MPDRPSDPVQGTLDMLNTRSGPRADCSSTIERDCGSGFAGRSNRNRAGVLGRSSAGRADPRGSANRERHSRGPFCPVFCAGAVGHRQHCLRLGSGVSRR